jgi:hypothetical protein
MLQSLPRTARLALRAWPSEEFVQEVAAQLLIALPWWRQPAAVGRTQIAIARVWPPVAAPAVTRGENRAYI